MKMIFRLIEISFVVVIGILSLPVSVLSQGGDIIKQKAELEEVKKDIVECQQNLDSLMGLEKKTLKEISDYEQRTSVNETVLRRLNNQLTGIRGNIKNSKEKLENSQASLISSQSRFEGNLKYYYVGSRWDVTEQEDEIRREKDALRRILYLRALAIYDKKQLSRASEFLKSAEKDYSVLLDKEKTVGDAQKKRKSEYILTSTQKEKREKELSRLRRKKENEAERLASLSEAARQMEELIAKLEIARQERERSASRTDFSYNTGNFISYKGALPAPLVGRITKGFGWSIDNITKLKSFSPEIEITGEPKSIIRTVADGVVAYMGSLRGYGIFIIVEHEDGYFSTYAGIDKPLVDKGEILSNDEKLGVSGSGIVKFELRRGKEPLDPVEWLKIDNLK